MRELLLEVMALRRARITWSSSKSSSSARPSSRSSGSSSRSSSPERMAFRRAARSGSSRSSASSNSASGIPGSKTLPCVSHSWHTLSGDRSSVSAWVCSGTAALAFFGVFFLPGALGGGGTSSGDGASALAAWILHTHEPFCGLYLHGAPFAVRAVQRADWVTWGLGGGREAGAARRCTWRRARRGQGGSRRPRGPARRSGLSRGCPFFTRCSGGAWGGVGHGFLFVHAVLLFKVLKGLVGCIGIPGVFLRGRRSPGDDFFILF